MPDYTPQMEKIIALLSRPGPSPWQPWIVATLSFLVGVLTVTLGRLLEPILLDVNRRARMRRVVYTDIQYIYARIEAFLENSDRDWVMHEIEEVKGFLKSRDEKYVNDNRDVLLRLHEHGAVEHFYRECRKLITDPTSCYINCGRVLWLVGFYLAEGDLEERYFTKFLPKAQATSFLERARFRHAGSTEKAKQLEEAVEELPLEADSNSLE